MKWLFTEMLLTKLKFHILECWNEKKCFFLLLHKSIDITFCKQVKTASKIKDGPHIKIIIVLVTIISHTSVVEVFIDCCIIVCNLYGRYWDVMCRDKLHMIHTSLLPCNPLSTAVILAKVFVSSTMASGEPCWGNMLGAAWVPVLAVRSVACRLRCRLQTGWGISTIGRRIVR